MNLQAVKTAMADLYAAVAAPADDSAGSAGSSGSAGNLDADTLLDIVDQAQQVINITGGIQTHAIAHLAAHDEVRDVEHESGWAWKRRGLGFTADDTASLVAPRLGVSVPVAQGRVEVAVHQVKVTPRLVDALGSGDLDLFRASIITRELIPCPDHIARAIVDRLLDHNTGENRWAETAGPLGARTRRHVARLAPDVAAATRDKAVKDRTLTRRAVSAAADQWYGLVPVEQSLVMWQAVDHLAHELQGANPDLTLDQARLDALQQLVLGQADVTIHLHATHADTPATPDPAAQNPAAQNRAAQEQPTEGTAELHDVDATPDINGAPTPAGLADRAIRGVVELGGLNRPGTTVVDPDRLPSCVRFVRSTPLGCHPGTGALTSGTVPKALAPTDLTPPDPRQVEARYRPSPALQRVIRLRDGHCRFPGCQIAARSCDLDHVIAWPAGPTTASNLICLCRRHHRIKQRLGWTVRLDPDGTVHWTDPAGRTTTTDPVNHLDRIHHPPAAAPASPPTPEPPATRVQPVPPVPDQASGERTSRGPTSRGPTSSEQSSSEPASGEPTNGAPRRRAPLTGAQLAALLRGGPANLDTLTRLSRAHPSLIDPTLAELHLARDLELAHAAARPPRVGSVDWHHQPWTSRLTLPTRGADDPPQPHDPPPF